MVGDEVQVPQLGYVCPASLELELVGRVSLQLEARVCVAFQFLRKANGVTCGSGGSRAGNG
jgi:hypothetical protein